MLRPGAQVKHLRILARLYVQRAVYESAAAVHEALARRRSGGLPEELVPLEERLDSLQSALMQVRAAQEISLAARTAGSRDQ